VTASFIAGRILGSCSIDVLVLSAEGDADGDGPSSR